jgi:hypothetical protein
VISLLNQESKKQIFVVRQVCSIRRTEQNRTEQEQEQEQWNRTIDRSIDPSFVLWFVPCPTCLLAICCLLPCVIPEGVRIPLLSRTCACRAPLTTCHSSRTSEKRISASSRRSFLIAPLISCIVSRLHLVCVFLTSKVAFFSFLLVITHFSFLSKWIFFALVMMFSWSTSLTRVACSHLS